MVDAVSERMLDTIALVGTADDVRAQYQERRRGRHEWTLLWLPGFTGVDGAAGVL